LWVNGDALQLDRVFVNLLLTNGINHSPRCGKVVIVMESYASYQVVKFIDERGGFCTEILCLLKDLLAKSASLKIRLLQPDGKLVSFVLMVNFTNDIEVLNLLSWTHLKFSTVI
jgi:phosphoglycerate-specific signal transduction histidine kinase